MGILRSIVPVLPRGGALFMHLQGELAGYIGRMSLTKTIQY